MPPAAVPAWSVALRWGTRIGFDADQKVAWRCRRPDADCDENGVCGLDSTPAAQPASRMTRTAKDNASYKGSLKVLGNLAPSWETRVCVGDFLSPSLVRHSGSLVVTSFYSLFSHPPLVEFPFPPSHTSASFYNPELQSSRDPVLARCVPPRLSFRPCLSDKTTNQHTTLVASDSKPRHTSTLDGRRLAAAVHSAHGRMRRLPPDLEKLHFRLCESRVAGERNSGRAVTTRAFLPRVVRKLSIRRLQCKIGTLKQADLLGSNGIRRWLASSSKASTYTRAHRRPPPSRCRRFACILLGPFPLVPSFGLPARGFLPASPAQMPSLTTLLERHAERS